MTVERGRGDGGEGGDGGEARRAPLAFPHLADALAEVPSRPHGPGEGELARGTIVARREWMVRVQSTPAVLRVGAVLVAGGAGDVAAYMAIADDDRWIAEHGTKLAFGDAALLFPAITERIYRK